MSHEPECQAFYRLNKPVPVCICEEVRRACQRAQQDAAQRVEDRISKHTDSYGQVIISADSIIAAIKGDSDG